MGKSHTVTEMDNDTENRRENGFKETGQSSAL